MKRLLILAFTFDFIFSTFVHADSIQLKNGNSIECTIIQEDEDHVIFVYKTIMIRMGQSNIDKIIKTSHTQEKPSLNARLQTKRIPDYSTILIELGSKKWAANSGMSKLMSAGTKSMAPMLYAATVGSPMPMMMQPKMMKAMALGRKPPLIWMRLVENFRARLL